MPSMLIIDDQMLVRRGLRQVLVEEFRGAVFGDAGTADEALAEVRRRAWDLIILDTSIRGEKGLSILQSIRKLRPKASVLVMDGRPEKQHAIRVLRLGALAYTTKNTTRAELVKAVSCVLSGKKYITASLSSLVSSETTPDHKAGRETLSAQELRVMLALAAGKRVGEIAAELSLNIKTVSTYKHRILKKLELRSIADVVRYVIEHQLS